MHLSGGERASHRVSRAGIAVGGMHEPETEPSEVENQVYDKLTRSVGAIVSLAVFANVILFFSALRSLEPKASNVLLIVKVLLVVVFATLFLLIHLSTNVKKNLSHLQIVWVSGLQKDL